MTEGASAAHSPTVKVVGTNGQISLGKQYAGRQVRVEEYEPGVWLVRTATVVPDNERWLHGPQAAADLQTAMAWSVAHAASDADTEDTLKRHAALDTLHKIRQLTWHQLYRDQGLKWEKITSVRPPQGIEQAGVGMPVWCPLIEPQLQSGQAVDQNAAAHQEHGRRADDRQPLHHSVPS